MKQLIYSIVTKKPIGISDGTYWIEEANGSLVDKLVIKHHYSHKTTNRFLSFLVCGQQGFLQIGYGIRPHEKQVVSRLITKDNYCEFDRMWLSGDLPKYSESRVIGLLLSYLKQQYKRIQFIITYADGSVGNVGTIYKATNAIIFGKFPVDFYMLPNGERIHPVSMWHRHKSRAKKLLEKLYPGIIHITDSFQYRYLYILSRKMKKQYYIDKQNEVADDYEVGNKLSSDSFEDLLI